MGDGEKDLCSHELQQLNTFQIPRKGGSPTEESPKRSSRMKTKSVII